MRRIAVLVCLFLACAAPVRALENECENCKNEPPCCVAMHSSHDPFECSWPIRGYCKLSTCALIEGDKQKCGWYWVFHDANDNDYHLGTNSPAGYGCMIGPSKETMRPRCDEPTPAPTAEPTMVPPTVVPSRVPTSRPTLIPTVPVPTRYIPPPQTQPTRATVPFEFPTAMPVDPGPRSAPVLQIPEYAACAKPNMFIAQTKRFFISIRTLDRALEETMDGYAQKTLLFIRNRLGAGR